MEQLHNPVAQPSIISTHFRGERPGSVESKTYLILLTKVQNLSTIWDLATQSAF
jgi:hypothetical protein